MESPEIKEFECVHGSLPENWQEVLDWHGVLPATKKTRPAKEKRQPTDTTPTSADDKCEPNP